MTGSAITFLLIGAVVLWGGLLVTLTITIKNERTSN
ncbi:MAG: MetS family NSS transporter small subunit [Clostridium sp.]